MNPFDSSSLPFNRRLNDIIAAFESAGASLLLLQCTQLEEMERFPDLVIAKSKTLRAVSRIADSLGA